MLAASAVLATGLMTGFGSVASASPAASVTEAAWGDQGSDDDHHDDDNDDDDFFIDFFAIWGPAGGIIAAS